MPGVAPQTTDWTLCVLCQQSTSESLRDPLKSTYENHSSAYETLEENLKALDNLDSLLPSINMHRTCYIMCDKKKIDRACKRKTKQQSPEIIMSPLKGRVRTAFPSSAETELPVCFFFDAVVELQIPDLEAHKSKYEVILSFKEDIGDSLLEESR